MSRRAARYYRSTFTLWRSSTQQDRYGQGARLEPVVIACQFKTGGSSTYKDDANREFKPRSEIWTEMRDVNGNIVEPPTQGDLIAIGTVNSVTPRGAFPVRTVNIDDVAIFDTQPDYVIRTG